VDAVVSSTSTVIAVNGIELGYEFFNLLGGGPRDASWDRCGMTHHRLAILPGVTHYDINAVPGLAAAVIPFLDA
jgi:hypothetical protein